jgi:ubiquinone/menaquinone biosynthesis C-methylase UbiE
MAVKWTRVKPGQRALDVCCGSGDLALLLAGAVGPTGSVSGLDFAADMLQVRGWRGCWLGSAGHHPVMMEQPQPVCGWSWQ